VIIRPSKMPPRRLESLRGVVMVDMVNGKIRIRKWPRPRGKPKDPTVQANNELFAQGNKAWKYLSAVQQDTFRDAVEGSPLLPRDLQTAMTFNRLFLFELEDGRVIYPVKLKREVSEALDTITQTVGQTLIRTAEGWEGQTPPTFGAWEFVQTIAITGSPSEVTFAWPDDALFLRVIYDGITGVGNVNRRAQVSTDNGASYANGATQYRQLYNNNAFLSLSYLLIHGDTTSAARSAVHEYEQWQSDKPFTQANSVGNVYGEVLSLGAPVNRMRIYNGSGAMTGGSITIYKR